MKRLIPLLLLISLLGGCTGSCRDSGAPAVTDSPEETTPPVIQESRPPRPTAPAVSPSPAPETPAETEEPEATPTDQPDVEPTAEPEPAQTEPQAPDDETVLAAYRSAVEAFWWFQVETLPLDRTDSREVDGRTYYRVDYPGIDSTASLRGYLKSLFSDDLVEMLLPYGGIQYIDVDGVLYGLEGGRGTDVTRGAESAQVLREGDDPNRRVVRVSVEVVDPEQGGAVVDVLTFDFPYEKVGEKWIFTSFSLVR